MTFFVFPYKQGSEGAKAVADGLGGKRILRQNSTYVQKPHHVVINWGASDCPFPTALNANVSGIIDKVAFFERLSGSGLTPNYTKSRDAAKFFIETMGRPIYCRTLIKGKDGEGIVIADKTDQLVDAPLYVEGVEKKAEYRIHMGRLPSGEIKILGIQWKTVSNSVPAGVDERVWAGEHTSFVWKINDTNVSIPPYAQEVCIRTMEKFPELTFAALDVVRCVNDGFYVLEMNSAPTQTPKTTEIYVDFFNKFKPAVPAPVETPVSVPQEPVSPDLVKLTVLLPPDKADMFGGMFLNLGFDAKVTA